MIHFFLHLFWTMINEEWNSKDAEQRLSFFFPSAKENNQIIELYCCQLSFGQLLDMLCHADDDATDDILYSCTNFFFPTIPFAWNLFTYRKVFRFRSPSRYSLSSSIQERTITLVVFFQLPWLTVWFIIAAIISSFRSYINQTIKLKPIDFLRGFKKSHFLSFSHVSFLCIFCVVINVLSTCSFRRKKGGKCRVIVGTGWTIRCRPFPWWQQTTSGAIWRSGAISMEIPVGWQPII